MDLSGIKAGFEFLANQMGGLLLSPGSAFSFTSLGMALILATAFYASKRLKRGRKLRARTLWRALFPRRIVQSPSNSADIGYLFFNALVMSLAFGWAVLSFDAVTNGIVAALVQVFGQPAQSALPPFLTNAIVTVILFLAYEWGYWFHHWLSHRVPFLWEFHRVHHSAEVLTPLTNFRVHPVDAWTFANILALSSATANGIANYAFGNTAHQYALSNTNLILVVFIHVYIHLQHTHLWIAFTGVLGRVFVSPAHHQVHHSMNPAHFNRNFGSCLALWDWVFGTLYVPSRTPERLTFGAEPDEFPAHTVGGELIAPFIRAARVALAPLRKRPAADQETAAKAEPSAGH